MKRALVLALVALLGLSAVAAAAAQPQCCWNGPGNNGQAGPGPNQGGCWWWNNNNNNSGAK
ncbi:MAG: hypothetical protein N3A57_01765 [Negativicutes bacterium]|nr:hypothetical protein [Negativicutes bacterium]